jgi:hypothetical protein
MGAKYAGMVYGQQAARAAQRQIREARAIVTVALRDLDPCDDTRLGSQAAAWRHVFRRLDRVLSEADRE